MSFINLLSPYLLPLIIGGLGYLFTYYFWEPIRQMDNQIKEIITILTKYANVRQYSKMKKSQDYDGPLIWREEIIINQDEITQTTHKLRQLAGELRSTMNTKKTYPLLSFLHLIPPKSKVETIAKCLIGWSSSFGQDDQSKLIGNFINTIARILKIPIT